jgi:REP element-mobilizing transposase RayT
VCHRYCRLLLRWRRVNSLTVHFVTWRLHSEQRPLAPAERTVVAAALRHGDGTSHRVIAFVVMDDHVHVLVQPKAVSLDRLTHSWRSFSAHELQCLHRREGAVWQQECDDRVVHGDEDLRQKTEYIVGNPWKRWPFIKGYPWVWEEERADGDKRGGDPQY